MGLVHHRGALLIETLSDVAAQANVHNFLKKPVFGRICFLRDVAAARVLDFARAAEVRLSVVASATEASATAIARIAKIGFSDIASLSRVDVVTLVSHSSQRSNHERTSQAKDDYPDAEHGDQ
jgi:hypothetical protein